MDFKTMGLVAGALGAVGALSYLGSRSSEPRVEETPKSGDGYKVVRNARFGGFWLSDEALSCLRKKGVDSDVSETGFIERFGTTLDRHDPALVSCVETLGNRASGDVASLTVGTVSGPYFIQEYDGAETIVQPHDLKWTDPSTYRRM